MVTHIILFSQLSSRALLNVAGFSVQRSLSSSMTYHSSMELDVPPCKRATPLSTCTMEGELSQDPIRGLRRRRTSPPSAAFSVQASFMPYTRDATRRTSVEAPRRPPFATVK